MKKSIYSLLKESTPVVQKQLPVKNLENELVTETTVPTHLDPIVNSWDHHAEVDSDTDKKIGDAMDKGTHTHFPLSDSASDIDPDVADHLTKHGWQVHDYKKGLATKKTMVGNPEAGIPMREKHIQKSIGSILGDTGATEDVKKAFAHDPSRASVKSFSKRSGGLHVVVSTSPQAIAGMTTGTHWKDQSCMNMEGGCHSDMLEHDSRHGTHVAFLVHHDDNEAFENGTPSKPVARIALKPFHHTDEHGKVDTIFRPEDRAYGSDNADFKTQVSKWASEKYPAKLGVTYKKNRNVYNDSQSSSFVAHDHKSIVKALEDGDDVDSVVDHHVINHALDHIESHVNSDNPYSRKSATYQISLAAKIPNLSSQHVSRLLKMSDSPNLVGEFGVSALRNKIVQNHGDKISSAEIDRHVKERGVNNMYGKVMMNPKLSQDHIDKMDTSQYSFLRHSNLKPHHLDKVIDETFTAPKSNVIRMLAHRFSPDQMNRIVSRATQTNSAVASNVVHTILKSPHFDQGMHDALMSKLGRDHVTRPGLSSSEEDTVLSKSKFAKASDVTDHFRDSLSKHAALIDNPNLSHEDAKYIKNRFVKEASNPNFFVSGFRRQIPKTLSKHMTDEDYHSIAKSGKSIEFEDAGHSKKYLNANQAHVKSLDDALTKHKESPEATEDSIDTHQEKLHKAIGTYANNIDSHVDNHAEDENSGRIKSFPEYHVARKHLDSIGTLKNYDMKGEHADDHLSDPTNHLDKIYMRTDRQARDDDELLRNLHA